MVYVQNKIYGVCTKQDSTKYLFNTFFFLYCTNPENMHQFLRQGQFYQMLLSELSSRGVVGKMLINF